MRIPYGRMKMCHMAADTPEELHAMAARLGLKRQWFQGRSSIPHYDVCWNKRQTAIAFGAIAVDPREIVMRFGVSRRVPCRKF
jgi:hypothetical protein